MPESNKCTFGAPASPRALEIAVQGKRLFPRKSLILRALAVDPPSDYDLDSTDPSDSMQSALGALSSLAFDMRSRHTHQLRHLFFTGNEKDWAGWEFQERVLYIFPLIFVGPGHCHASLGDEAERLILETPEIFHMVFQAWAFALNSFHRSLPLHTRTVLLFIIPASEETLFMQAFHQVSPDPVTICMSFLNEQVSKKMPGISLKALDYIVTAFLSNIPKDANSEVYRSLLKAGALQAVITAVRRLSTPEFARSVHEFDRDSYFLSIGRLHTFVAMTVSRNGVPAIAQALDYGWLKALYAAAYFIERQRAVTRTESINATVCECITIVLADFFSFPSIVRRFVKYTNRILADDSKAFDFRESSPLYKFGSAWKDAIKKATHLDRLRQDYKKSTVICANEECNTTPDQSHFVQVCSHWNAGHRKKCGSDRIFGPSGLSTLSPHGNTYDTTFFTFIVDSTLQSLRLRLLPSLKAFLENHSETECRPRNSSQFILMLEFFFRTDDDDDSEHSLTCERGRTDDVEWHFRCLTNAPKNFVIPIGRGKKYLERGEVMYYASFPDYHLSGVFNLLKRT
ncbi:hypothetical protein BT96DRAFT_922878 [Gymnopus androsaceus JB14]|uniref:Uncharacterized protein n=1 Tax=Gymnopus androsaceus JB14 TaxID=1447944 RepID=A0A6A4HB97_9AGAR|nr:hypothetical protein BT96DRAFT_922878 [Gymnopus androsaceus JB14]